jgi:hypothetical protein
MVATFADFGVRRYPRYGPSTGPAHPAQLLDGQVSLVPTGYNHPVGTSCEPLWTELVREDVLQTRADPESNRIAAVVQD